MTANINWNSLASEYASEHQSRQNQVCHMIPSLAHNLIHLFVGPAWIVQKLAKGGFGISLW